MHTLNSAQALWGVRDGISPVEDPTRPDQSMDRFGVQYDPKHPSTRLGGPGRQGDPLVSKEAGTSDSTEHNATNRPATDGGHAPARKGRCKCQKGPQPTGAIR